MWYVVYSIWGILVLVLMPGVVSAQERGIGVSPAEISVNGNIDWPYSVPITVTNFSAEQEQFEISGASANPGRFVLEAGARKRVLVTFDEPAEGVLRVLSTETSTEGFTTGTGVKIPFHVQGPSNSTFLASAHETGGAFPYIFGSAIVLVTLLLLWQIAKVVQPWLISSKQ